GPPSRRRAARPLPARSPRSPARVPERPRPGNARRARAPAPSPARWAAALPRPTVPRVHPRGLRARERSRRVGFRGRQRVLLWRRAAVCRLPALACPQPWGAATMDSRFTPFPSPGPGSYGSQNVHRCFEASFSVWTIWLGPRRRGRTGEPQDSSTGRSKGLDRPSRRRSRILHDPSIQVEGPGRRSLVRILLRPLQGFAEFLLQKPVAVLHGGEFAVEHVGGPGLVLVQPLEQGVEVLAAGRRLLGPAVGQDLPGRRVDDQLGFALGAADGQLPGLAHSPIVPDLW